ncbi:MAG TPA: type II toxin-antitoxin system VapC family toxin [Actinomycetota bacterium]
MILLDTHALLWWAAGSDRLSPGAARAIARADTILVSPISCWEVATLVGKGRIALDRDVYVWVLDLFSLDEVELAPLTPQMAVAAALLGTAGFHGDPADRFLYATALEHSVPLVTKDESIRSYAEKAGDLRTIW